MLPISKGQCPVISWWIVPNTRWHLIISWLLGWGCMPNWIWTIAQLWSRLYHYTLILTRLYKIKLAVLFELVIKVSISHPPLWKYVFSLVFSTLHFFYSPFLCHHFSWPILSPSHHPHPHPHIISISIINLFPLPLPPPPPHHYHYQLSFFLTTFSPQCVILYWVTSSACGVAQNLALMHPGLRRMCRIPYTPSERENPYQHLWAQMQKRLRRKSKEINEKKDGQINWWISE